MRALSFLGASGSGKTWLIERLLPALARRGVRAVVVKHSHHPVEPGPEGKDSTRFARAGAAGVALVGPGGVAAFVPSPADPSLEDVLARLPAADLAIVESWRALGLPFVEVLAPEGLRVAPAQGAVRVALVSDAPSAAAAPDVPSFRRDDVEPLAALVVRWLAE